MHLYVVMHAGLFVPENNNTDMHKNRTHTFERMPRPMAGRDIAYEFSAVFLEGINILALQTFYVTVVLYY